MNELKQLKGLLQSSTEGQRLATVESVLDAARITVRFASGARRRVYGQAPAGSLVLVRGERLLSRVAAVNASTMTID